METVNLEPLADMNPLPCDTCRHQVRCGKSNDECARWWFKDYQRSEHIKDTVALVISTVLVMLICSFVLYALYFMPIPWL